jgi:cytochrome c oxidase cbb3-type subunit III
MGFLAAPAAALCISLTTIAAAQQEAAAPQQALPQAEANAPQTPGFGQPAIPQNPTVKDTPGELYGKFLQLPVSGLLPGDVHPKVEINNPQESSEAATRGMRYFQAFNCVGCHAPNGGGGIGPSFSEGTFQFGGAPANIYLSIVQGRSLGMPAWGTVLPDEVIWDLVAYIQSISNSPQTQWGTTISRTSPNIEQVPAEFESTTHPWAFTQAFMKGQEPPK